MTDIRRHSHPATEWVTNLLVSSVHFEVQQRVAWSLPKNEETVEEEVGYRPIALAPSPPFSLDCDDFETQKI